MSKTVSELSAELGVSKQYLNRVLSQNNLGRKIGNKKLVSDSDVRDVIVFRNVIVVCGVRDVILVRQLQILILSHL